MIVEKLIEKFSSSFEMKRIGRFGVKMRVKEDVMERVIVS